MTLEMNYIHCALQDVLQDPSFNTKSSVAAAARQDALTLLHWCQQEENSEEVNQFMKQVMADMSQCLAAFKVKKGGHDRLWKNTLLFEHQRNLRFNGFRFGSGLFSFRISTGWDLYPLQFPLET